MIGKYTFFFIFVSNFSSIFSSPKNIAELLSHLIMVWIVSSEQSINVFDFHAFDSLPCPLKAVGIFEKKCQYYVQCGA